MLKQDVRLNLRNKGSGFTPGALKWTGYGLAHIVALRRRSEDGSPSCQR